MIAAEIRLIDRGVFEADACRIERDAVHAYGRFRRRTGASYAELSYGPAGAYTWPLRQCVEIRWMAEPEVIS